MSSKGAVNHTSGWILYGFPFTRGPKAAGELVEVSGMNMVLSWIIFCTSAIRSFLPLTELSLWYLSHTA